MTTKRMPWTAYRVEYDNGNCRYFNNDHNALLHAGSKAKSMALVRVWHPDGTLVARWEHGRNVYYYPYIPDSLV